MQCPACKSENQPNANFCSNCGAVLGIGDKASSSPSVDPFQRLGPKAYVDRLTESSGRIGSERRVVTTLFADIVNSTGMAEQLDPEDVTAIMNGAFTILAKPVHAFGGTVARLMGDGVLCLFGAPVAHGDDAERACRAGLAMVAHITTYSDRVKESHGLRDFAVRVGISTGLAVVGEVGSDTRTEYTAMGDAVNLAARLQGAAEPNHVLVCAETARLVDSTLSVREAGQLTLKGKTQPVAAFELMPERKSASIASTGAATSRKAARNALLSAVEDLCRGRGSVLMLEAEAGMGKTWLLTECVDQLPATVKCATGSPATLGQSSDYTGARDLLLTIIGAEPFSAPRDIEIALKTTLEQVTAPDGLSDPANRAMLPCLRLLLDLPIVEQDRSVIESADKSDVSTCIEFALCRLVELMAARSPLILILEDAHAVDRYTLTLVERLAELSLSLPLLVVLSARPGESILQGALQNPESPLSTLPRRVALNPLSGEESIELLQELSRAESLTLDMLKPIARAGAGNPLHLKEILRTVVERARNLPGGARSSLFTLRDIDLPQTVQAAILSRVDRLPYRSKRLLQLASVFGRYFHREAMLRATTLDSSDASINEALNDLIHGGFIELAPAAVPNAPADVSESSIGVSASYVVGLLAGLRYRFTNSLTAEVVYNSLLKTDRVKLHKQAGELLEEIFSDRCEDLAPTLAYHFERGQTPQKAIPCLLTAAEKALGAGVDARARRYLDRARTLSHDNPGLVELAMQDKLQSLWESVRE